MPGAAPVPSVRRMTTTAAALDTAAVEAFAGRVLTDLAGAAGTAMTVIGDRLGLYQALTGTGPTTAAALAGRTGVNHRLVAEWLGAQTVSGYLRTTQTPTPTSCPPSTPWRCRWSPPPDDGAAADLGPGDAYRIEPGHDAWVLGDEPFIALEFESKTAETNVEA